MIFDSGDWDFYPVEGEPNTFIGEKNEYVYCHQQNEEQQNEEEDIFYGKMIIRAKFRRVGIKHGMYLYELVPTEA